MKPFSPNTTKIYQLLLNSPTPLSGKQIANELNFIPTTIYRLVKPLIVMGLVKLNLNKPHTFQAQPLDQSLGMFLLHQSNWFTFHFKSKITPKSAPTNVSFDISFDFIQGRDSLMQVSVDEVNTSKNSIELLRSGHEIPADLMAAMGQAIQRGVNIKMLIQDYDESNKLEVENWQKNGIIVRHTPQKNLRLMIYDHQTAYFMSYKHSDSSEDLGMKVTYPPFAIMLSQIFAQFWNKSQRID